jgi:hypothetical protein
MVPKSPVRRCFADLIGDSYFVLLRRCTWVLADDSKHRPNPASLSLMNRRNGKQHNAHHSQARVGIGLSS